jgi:hypothetical protein
MEDADEPGNIIWESKHIKGFNLYKRILLGLGLIAIMLIISFSVIVSLMIKSVRLDSDFPKIDCGKLYSDYAGDEQRIEKQVINYYLEQEAAADETSGTLSLPPRVGALRCYCLKEAEEFKVYTAEEQGLDDVLRDSYPIEYWLSSSSKLPHKFTDWEGV